MLRKFSVLLVSKNNNYPNSSTIYQRVFPHFSSIKGALVHLPKNINRQHFHFVWTNVAMNARQNQFHQHQSISFTKPIKSIGQDNPSKDRFYFDQPKCTRIQLNNVRTSIKDTWRILFNSLITDWLRWRRVLLLRKKGHHAFKFFFVVRENWNYFRVKIFLLCLCEVITEQFLPVNILSIQESLLTKWTFSISAGKVNQINQSKCVMMMQEV